MSLLTPFLDWVAALDRLPDALRGIRPARCTAWRWTCGPRRAARPCGG